MKLTEHITIRVKNKDIYKTYCDIRDIFNEQPIHGVKNILSICKEDDIVILYLESSEHGGLFISHSNVSYYNTTRPHLPQYTLETLKEKYTMSVNTSQTFVVKTGRHPLLMRALYDAATQSRYCFKVDQTNWAENCTPMDGILFIPEYDTIYIYTDDSEKKLGDAICPTMPFDEAIQHLTNMEPHLTVDIGQSGANSVVGIDAKSIAIGCTKFNEATIAEMIVRRNYAMDPIMADSSPVEFTRDGGIIYNGHTVKSSLVEKIIRKYEKAVKEKLDGKI